MSDGTKQVGQAQSNITPENLGTMAELIAANDKCLRMYRTVGVCRSRASGGIIDHTQVENIWAETPDQAKLKYAIGSPDCLKDDPRGIWGVEATPQIQ